MGESSLDKIRKLEKEIKDQNAIRAEYNKELLEAEKKLKSKEITQQQYERVKKKHDDHCGKINEKIQAARRGIEELRSE
ncbi:MAG: hypothetical protein A4E32_01350 [Methanomassiliicoccales archaeon PtaU1.Bin124]|nr:MAG: hypothetical protein A4E32_01350 [Methanomassiliicoccales archaeon PtaU1.Bin124]